VPGIAHAVRIGLNKAEVAQKAKAPSRWSSSEFGACLAVGPCELLSGMLAGLPLAPPAVARRAARRGPATACPSAGRRVAHLWEDSQASVRTCKCLRQRAGLAGLAAAFVVCVLGEPFTERAPRAHSVAALTENGNRQLTQRWARYRRRSRTLAANEWPLLGAETSVVVNRFACQ
jgi:hypothetical protein